MMMKSTSKLITNPVEAVDVLVDLLESVQFRGKPAVRPPPRQWFDADRFRWFFTTLRKDPHLQLRFEDFSSERPSLEQWREWFDNQMGAPPPEPK